MATGCITGREAASISNREETFVSVREDGEGTDRKRESGEREVSATFNHPSSSTSDKGCVNNCDKKPLCRVTAYARTGESNSDHGLTPSNEKASKVKKKKKNGKKKGAQEKRGVSTGPSEADKPGECIGHLEQSMRSLAIDDELLARGPVRNKDCHEQRNKPYTRALDHDVSAFVNSLLPEEIVRDKPTANVSPQTRNGGPQFTQHQLQQQQPQQQQQLFLQQQQQQLFLQQQSAQHPQQVPQMLQQQHLLYSTTGSALPSIPSSSPVPVAFCAPSQIQGVLAPNDGLVPQVICVPVQVNGLTYFKVMSNGQFGSPQISTQSQETAPKSTPAQNLPFHAVNGVTSTATSQGQAMIVNSPATIVNPAREGIPTVVPDTFEVEEPPKTKRGRGRKPNPKGKVIDKKKTPKKSASKAKLSSTGSVDVDNADINAQDDSQSSGVSSSSSHNTGQRSASSGNCRSDFRETDSANISNTDNFGIVAANVEPERNEPGNVGHCRIGPGSVGPSSVGSSSVGPESVRPESVGTNFPDDGSFGPSSDTSYLSANSGSVAPLSVGGAIETDDEASLDINDFLSKENSESRDALKENTGTCTTTDELFQLAEEIVESDLKETTAARQLEMRSGTQLQTQQGSTCMNTVEENPLELFDQQDSSDLMNMLCSLPFSEVPEPMESLEAILDQISGDPLPTSKQRTQFTATTTQPPAVSNVGDVEIPSATVPSVNHVSCHYTSNSAQGQSVEVDVRNEQAQSAPGAQDTTRQPGSLQLNARVQIGLNRMSPQTSLNFIMESFRPIAPKHPN